MPVCRIPNTQYPGRPIAPYGYAVYGYPWCAEFRRRISHTPVVGMGLWDAELSMDMGVMSTYPSAQSGLCDLST